MTMTTPGPSADQPLTAQGTVVGTFQYMSPEQTEGKEADARSDIFAMGALLYEMVTGKRAFTGKSQASIVAAILASEPAPISVAQPMTPPALAQVVKTCLAKDPEERFQTVHDLKLQLKWIAEASSSQLAAPAQVRARRVVQKRTLLIAAVAGWLLAAAALAIFLSRRNQLEEARRPLTASWLAPPDTEFPPRCTPARPRFLLTAQNLPSLQATNPTQSCGFATCPAEPCRPLVMPTAQDIHFGRLTVRTSDFSPLEN